MLKDVSLEIIQKCLNQCLHCSSNSTYESHMMLNYQTIVDVIDDITMLNASRLCLSGGEPFLHPDIIDIIAYAASKGLVLDVYSCGVVGEYNNEKSISVDYFMKCKSIGLHRVMFNLQAPNANLYFKIMGRNNFDIVIQSIKNANIAGIETEIHFVPMKLNVNEVDQLLDLVGKIGVKNTSFLKLVPHGRAKVNKDEIMLSDFETEKLQKELFGLEAQGKNIRIGLPLTMTSEENSCHAVREKLYIKYDGSVFGCEAFKYIALDNIEGKTINPDNILQKRVLDIFEKSEFLENSINLVDEFSSYKSGCDNCPVQKYLKGRNINNVQN
ncbi:MAG: radical SAM protein [Candidatus Galacturonibacter soehngenii]|nr:radical SAM protein [Candidatus Galacturonibacter soehngenii]